MTVVENQATRALQTLADTKSGKDKIKAIATELYRRGIEPEEIGRLARIKMWQGLIKNKYDEAEIHDLFGFHLAPSWDEGPQWPVMQPGPRMRVPKYQPVIEPTGTQRMVVLPDMQIGYFRNSDGEVEAIHDEAAIDAALAIIKASKPSIIVMLGDNLDLAEFGKYRMSPAFQAMTQHGIDYATTLCARVRAAAPKADIYWLAGNHEERLPHWIQDNAAAAFGIRQGNSPKTWPVLSIPHLCRLDEYGIIYKPGYPASDLWITPKLKIIHGVKVKSNGSTAHMYLAGAKVSIIYGHIHRIERAHITREDFEGSAEIMAASPGCLARIDGVVPSTGQGLDLDGRPLPHIENWNQGLAVVTLHEDDTFDYEQVHIRSGQAYWRDKLFGAPNAAAA